MGTNIEGALRITLLVALPVSIYGRRPNGYGRRKNIRNGALGKVHFVSRRLLDSVADQPCRPLQLSYPPLEHAGRTWTTVGRTNKMGYYRNCFRGRGQPGTTCGGSHHCDYHHRLSRSCSGQYFIPYALAIITIIKYYDNLRLSWEPYLSAGTQRAGSCDAAGY